MGCATFLIRTGLDFICDFSLLSKGEDRPIGEVKLFSDGGDTLTLPGEGLGLGLGDGFLGEGLGFGLIDGFLGEGLGLGLIDGLLGEGLGLGLIDGFLGEGLGLGLIDGFIGEGLGLGLGDGFTLGDTEGATDGLRTGDLKAEGLTAIERLGNLGEGLGEETRIFEGALVFRAFSG